MEANICPGIFWGAKVLKQSESGNDFTFIKRFKAYFVIVKFGSFKKFVDVWIMSAYNHKYGQFDDDDPRVKDIFMNKVTSSTIESFIKSKDITTRFIPVK